MTIFPNRIGFRKVFLGLPTWCVGFDVWVLGCLSVWVCVLEWGRGGSAWVQTGGRLRKHFKLFLVITASLRSSQSFLEKSW